MIRGLLLAGSSDPPVPLPPQVDRFTVQRQVTDMTSLSLNSNIGGRTYRATRIIRAESKNPRIILSNYYNIGGPAPTFTAQASIEYGGQIYPVTWGGATSVSIPNTGSALSDPIVMPLVLATPISVRIYSADATVPAWGAAGKDTHQDGNHLTDPTWPTFDRASTPDAWQPSPLGILALAPTAQVVPIILGDSIADISASTANGGGWFRRASDSLNLPAIGFGIPVTQFAGRMDTSYTPWGLSAGTHALVEFGVNDLRSYDQPTVRTNALAYWRYILAQQPGLPMWQTTATPLTDSTDGWATLANQTVSANSTTRPAWNAWVKDGCPLTTDGTTWAATGTAGALRAGNPAHPIRGIVDTGGALESGPDSGLWRVDHGKPTTDGIHPSYPAANVDMSAPVKVWMAGLS